MLKLISGRYFLEGFYPSPFRVVWAAIKGAIEKPGKEQVRVKRGKSLLIR